jgi:hypothetical protein
VIELLPSIQKALDSIPNAAKEKGRNRKRKKSERLCEVKD